MSSREPESGSVPPSSADNPLKRALHVAYGAGGPISEEGGSSVLGDLLGTSAARNVRLRGPDDDQLAALTLNTSELPDGVQRVGRYQIVGELGRGGMGVILEGRDLDLGREVALKVLLSAHAGKPQMVERFIEEAQIGGQLQHPSIAPVHELGVMGGNRPYFAMRMVRGKTLHSLLEARKSVDEDRARFLGIFQKVCQAVAYAHARRVIHRDLKPSNVMVGAFGEVQVVDWGLAKVLGGQTEEAETRQTVSEPESAISTVRSSVPHADSTETAAGSILGTPAYMAPEQARGEVHLVDERADVFGLGAMLCEILTGEPPRSGRQRESGPEFGEPEAAGARLEHSGADIELVKLARRCLEPEREKRPRHAGIVAEEIAQYIDSVEERLRKAEIEQAAAKARALEAQGRVAAERRARRRTVALAALVLGLVVCGGGGWLWVKAERDERARKLATEVQETLDRCQAARERANVAGLGDFADWSEARGAAERARALLGDTGAGDQELRSRVDDVLNEIREEERDRRLLADLDAARLAAAESYDPVRKTFAHERTVALYREALLKWGLAPGEIAASVAAERIRERWDTVGLELISALDDWAASAEHDSPGLQQESPMAWLREVALAADDDPWRTALRDAMRVTDKNQRRARLEELASSVEVVRQPAVSIVRLVRTLDWLEMFTRAVTLLERAWKNRPGDFWLNHYLGVILLEGKPARLEEAARHLTAAVALRPHTATAHHNLAIVLSRQGKLDAAIAHVERAIELLPGHANAHNTRGLILDAQGKPEESYASFRLAIALGGDSVEVYYLNLGECLKDQGKLDEAATCYREAIALEPGMVQAHLGLCQVLKLRGNLPEALECHGEFLRLHPANANAQASLGNILLEQGKLDEAIAAFERARALEPANFKFHDNLGVALKRRGKFDEAMACYRRAIELQPDVAGTHYNLAIALSDRDSPEEAVSSFREAIRLKPDHVGAHNNLGIALSNLGAIDEAIAAYRKAIDLKPDHVPAHINLGYTLGRQGKQEEAIASCRMAITHAPGAAYPHKHFGAVLQSLGLFADALVELRRAHEIAPENAETSELVAHAERLVELDRKLPSILSGAGPPSDPAESAEFAELCHQKRLFAAAVRLWVTVLAARPDLAGNLQAGHRYNAACAAALAGAGQGKDAGDLDGAARRRLREQARTWLEADLELWRARLESREGTDLAGLQRVLKHWRRDPDLAGIRDAGARQGLEQSEQGELARLWADVATAIERARSLNAEKSARP